MQLIVSGQHCQGGGAGGGRVGHMSNVSAQLSTRVAGFGLFEVQKKQMWPFLKLVGLEIFENLLSSWLFFSLWKFIKKNPNIFPS